MVSNYPSPHARAPASLRIVRTSLGAAPHGAAPTCTWSDALVCVGVPRGLGSGLPGTQAALRTAAATKQREKLVSLTPLPTYADTVDHSAACRQRRPKAGVLISNGGIKPPPLRCL